MSFDPFCETCVARKGLRVHERVYPHPNPYRPRGLTCSRCGIDLPGPEDGGWVLLVDDEDGRLEGICNVCRGKERRETSLALRPREESEEDANEDRPGTPGKPIEVVPRGDRKDGHLVIGLIADTHGVLDRQVLELFAGVDHIVHAGDLDEPGVLDRLAKIAPVTAVRGNCDYGTMGGRAARGGPALRRRPVPARRPPRGHRPRNTFAVRGRRRPRLRSHPHPGRRARRRCPGAQPRLAELPARLQPPQRRAALHHRRPGGESGVPPALTFTARHVLR